ncbi:hypothetical protein [Paraglaciecola chathamensis]|uniref:hypothetical protein n=1 Tax=Paraglaciecola chathamensis TaxID=368405 RepID=UPI000586D719|nr:hypothetical protein [Paraglaciecola agarilytica]
MTKKIHHNMTVFEKYKASGNPRYFISILFFSSSALSIFVLLIQAILQRSFSSQIVAAGVFIFFLGLGVYQNREAENSFASCGQALLYAILGAGIAFAGWWL